MTCRSHILDTTLSQINSNFLIFYLLKPDWNLIENRLNIDVSSSKPKNTLIFDEHHVKCTDTWIRDVEIKNTNRLHYHLYDASANSYGGRNQSEVIKRICRAKITLNNEKPLLTSKNVGLKIWKNLFGYVCRV